MPDQLQLPLVYTSITERVCLDCGVDISGRGARAKRCEEHQAYWRLVWQRDNARKWRAANLEKARDRERKWRAANPEKYQAAGRKYRAANRGKERQYDISRRAANPEKYRERYRKWRAANPEKYRAAGRKYDAANPERRRERVQLRRARKLAQLGEVSKGITLQLLASQEYRCAACGTDIRSPQPYPPGSHYPNFARRHAR